MMLSLNAIRFVCVCTPNYTFWYAIYWMHCRPKTIDEQTIYNFSSKWFSSSHLKNAFFLIFLYILILENIAIDIRDKNSMHVNM